MMLGWWVRVYNALMAELFMGFEIVLKWME